MTTTTIASANEYKLVSFLMEQRATGAAAAAAVAEDGAAAVQKLPATRCTRPLAE